MIEPICTTLNHPLQMVDSKGFLWFIFILNHFEPVNLDSLVHSDFEPTASSASFCRTPLCRDSPLPPTPHGALKGGKTWRGLASALITRINPLSHELAEQREDFGNVSEKFALINQRLTTGLPQPLGETTTNYKLTGRPKMAPPRNRVFWA